MKNTNPKATGPDRAKAEKALLKKPLKRGPQFSEPEALRLFHELEVHEIELEMQNEELKVARADAQDAANKYTELYNSAPSGYFTLSQEGKIMGLNTRGANMLGKEHTSLIKSQFASYIHNDSKQVFNFFLGKIFETKVKETCEVFLGPKVNKPIYCYITGIVSETQGNCLLTMIDITGRKTAEDALIASETRYRRLFESAKDGILILDAETGMIVDANPFLIKLLGFTEEQLINKEIWGIGFFKDIAANKKKFLELQQNKYVRYEDLPLETADGRMIHVEFVSNVYAVDYYKVIQCNIRDITLRKKAEEDLVKAKEKAEDSDRLKSAFLANMSHEIRTPMNGILGFTELLKEGKLTGEKQQKYISIIEKSGIRMLNIINDIISISKVESGQVEVFISETNINEQVEYIYTFFKPVIQQKGIQFFFQNSLTAAEANINTDREKLYAILTNLVKNAIKFTNKGSIVFGYEKKDDFIEFFVKDTGVGISQEQKKVVFERFRQGNDSLTRKFEGAGLGLSISKAYVEMLGGKIWVESKVGKGSSFYFTIPANVELVSKPGIEKILLPNKEVPGNKNLKILIAEDDESSEMLITIAIEIFSDAILSVRTGSDAVKVCRDNPDIDLVLMDIQLPEMDGYEATRQIRKFNKQVVIIAQTANALTGEREKVINAGCNDYIPKPFNKNLLRGIIEKHFNN